ncbi:small-conductance mechanosensitive channel [Neobacillus niacini]|uniref:mechanosensitive ion channel n=1 Tax=Neobacillus niacini TaxID=86668 RepID=UPI002863F241|nr:mechanosensitive ion channel [Neobacillus niacini]MDR7079655.1 small-conductance mechanosensitive channel [Neobacillus niacini]
MNVENMMSGWYIYTDQIPHLLLALLVLLIGWLVAKGIRRAVEAALERSTLDDKLFSGFKNRKYSTESIMGKIVYYTLLVVVWIIFFNMLNLSLIAAPLVKMMSTLTAAIPHLLKAALILLFAWGIAFLLRYLFIKGAGVIRLGEKLVKWKMANSALEAANRINGIGKVIFYFVLLLFIPAVLGALELEGISEPFENALTMILAFIPKLFAAALIVLIGWLIAKIVRDILTNFLKSLGADKLGSRFGFLKNGEEASLSNLAGNIVFILILIPVIITALEKLELKGISEPAVAMLQDVLSMIPNIIVAIILILTGIWLGKWVEKLVSQMLWRLRFDHVFHQMGIGALTPEQPKYTLSQMVGILAKIIVVLLFTVEALQIVQLNFLVTLATGVIAYLPMLLTAVIILGLGLFVGQFIEQLLQNIVKHSYSRMLARIAKYTIFTITVFMALDQLGVAHSIVNAAFILVLGGLALSFGLAFGLGGTEFARKYLGKLDNKLESEK